MTDAGLLDGENDKAELEAAEKIRGVFNELQGVLPYEEKGVKLTRELNALLEHYYKKYYPESATNTSTAGGRAA